MFGRLRHKFNEYRFNKRMARQRYKRGFADVDCWGMNYWLTSTFPDMILHLRDMKHGAPDLPFEEFDTFPKEWKQVEMNKLNNWHIQNKYTFEPNSIFTKWYIILTRIAYCLKEADEDKEVFNKYADDYNKAVWGEDYGKEKTFTEFWGKHCEKVDGGYIIKTGEAPEELHKNYWEEEKRIEEYKVSMKDEALDLIKKYFYCLWD